MTAMVRVGISSWTEPTLIEAGFYPAEARDAAGRLRYYSARFPLAEVDAPYYALPTRHQAEVWSARTPADFTMNVKAYALLTAHYTDPRRLPRDLFRALPAALREKPRLYPRHVGPAFLEEIARRFSDALAPLRDSGKLGLLLFQFPVWFPCSRRSREELLEVRRRFPRDRVAVEFRNATWLSERNREETLRFLREHGLVYTCVDEPQGFPSSVPPVAAATASVALVRFHGRNARMWDRRTRSAAQRLDHRYELGELREWVPRVRHLAIAADEVHVVMNNCHRDYAVTNARQMAALLAAAGVGRVRPIVRLDEVPGAADAPPARVTAGAGVRSGDRAAPGSSAPAPR